MILVGVPTRGLIHYRVASALGKLESQGFEVIYGQSSYGVEAARGKIIKHFLAFKQYSYLMFIDDDIVVPKDIVARLMHHDKDIISASYPIFQDGRLLDASAVFVEDSYYRKLELNGKNRVEVDAVGFGACLIKREALKKSFKKGCLQIDYDYDYEPIKGEDYKLCEAIRAAGYQIYVDFSSKVEHLKTINLEGVM